MQSIRITRLDNASVTIGSDRPYAAIHQFGGIIRPKSGGRLKFQVNGQWFSAKQVTIPARPFFPFRNGKLIESARAAVESTARVKLAALLGPS
jgi:phage gpG-like protein